MMHEGAAAGMWPVGAAACRSLHAGGRCHVLWLLWRSHVVLQLPIRQAFQAALCVPLLCFFPGMV